MTDTIYPAGGSGTGMQQAARMGTVHPACVLRGCQQAMSHQQYVAPPRGCICPPTSEQTCQSPTCPRKDHVG